MNLYKIPAVGSVWHERRQQYQGRTVRVVEADEHFVLVQSLTNNRGETVPARKPTRVRMSLWPKYWIPKA